ncbi:MAG TPA: sigma-70 family RNA polymerase sigma factor [Gemmatimonadota bacterium]|jgi:RNA polymerase sigma-70 factor (ECF subfamily)
MERGPLPPAIEIQPLLVRVAERDTHALAQLYDATSRYVFGILRRMLWSPEGAEEVAQEVYVQVWNTAASFDPLRASAWSWLALLTRGRAIDRMRAEGSQRDASEDVQRLASRATTADEPDGNPMHDVARSERAEVVHAALRELPGDQRRALELAFFGGLTHREIAERTDTPLGSVRTRIRTALLELRERLEAEIGG